MPGTWCQFIVCQTYCVPPCPVPPALSASSEGAAVGNMFVLTSSPAALGWTLHHRVLGWGHGNLPHLCALVPYLLLPAINPGLGWGRGHDYHLCPAFLGSQAGFRHMRGKVGSGACVAILSVGLDKVCHKRWR